MAKTKTRKNVINPVPKFAVGDRIQHPKFGTGIIKKIDNPMFPDYEFFYFVDFARRNGGDGTKVWLPKVKTEKCERVPF